MFITEQERICGTAKHLSPKKLLARLRKLESLLDALWGIRQLDVHGLFKKMGHFQL